ncbi:MAG TPA: DinB family protein [Ktedonobacterales bacterium]|jgi:hypothetical protein
MAAETHITLEAVTTSLEETWSRLERVLARIGPVLSAGPDAGGWTPRQLLSHLIGAWQRVPVHAGFYLAGAKDVPIQLHDPYWLKEWETAPFESFLLAFRAAYDSNKAFLRQLDPAMLSRRARTPFGESSLGELLIGSYTGHVGNFHLPQLEAFLVQ